MSHVKNQKNSIRGNTVQYNTKFIDAPYRWLSDNGLKLENYNSKNVMDKNQRN